MIFGQRVVVKEAFENKQLKRVISEDSRNVYVCTDEEYQASVAEKRSPICIGFPRQFILRVMNEG